MNPTSSTLKFVGVAAVSALLAFGAWKGSQPSLVEGYGEVGQAFFPDFDDVTKASALTVTDFDGDEKDVMSFSVRQNDDGLWVIPSHHDYPAEAADRLAKTATSLLAVKKTAVKSRSKDDWKRFGVVDPSDDGVATADERGTRLTLSDGSGNPLVDLIVGSQVEGQDNQYHVREPEKSTTYIAQLDVDLSAKFSDWIEPDLLKITASDVVKIALDNYSINEERGAVEKVELLEFQKEDLKTTGDWTLAGLDEDKEELDKSPVSSIATNLDNLQIVGVRPKPEGLDDNMRVNPVVKQILQSQMQALGYFIGAGPDGKERLYSNEGELIAGTEKGVEYTLYFGEIARGSGKEIEVGLKDEKAADDEKSADDEKAADIDETGDAPEPAEEDSEDGPRRYLLVKVGFNDALLGEKPVAPVEPVKPEILNEEEQGDDKGGDDKGGDDKGGDDKGGDDKSKDDAAGEAGKDEEQDADDGSSEEGDACNPDEEEKSDATEPDAATEPAAKSEEQDDKSEQQEAAADDRPDPAKDDQPAGDQAADKAQDDKPKDDKPAAEDKAEDKPKVPEKTPKQLAQEEYDAAMQAYRTQKATYDDDLKKYEDRVKEGQEKADELALRFSGWYYVISSDSFEKFRVTRKDVVSKKEEEKDDQSKADDASAADTGK